MVYLHKKQHFVDTLDENCSQMLRLRVDKECLKNQYLIHLHPLFRILGIIKKEDVFIQIEFNTLRVYNILKWKLKCYSVDRLLIITLTTKAMIEKMLYIRTQNPKAQQLVFY